MKLNRSVALRFGVGVAVVSASLVAFTGGSVFHEARLGAQGTSQAPARLPRVDEYFPVKTDYITTDRSILTIRHQPTSTCYILLYPAGDVLMPVEKERCEAPPAERP